MLKSRTTTIRLLAAELVSERLFVVSDPGPVDLQKRGDLGPQTWCLSTLHANELVQDGSESAADESTPLDGVVVVEAHQLETEVGWALLKAMGQKANRRLLVLSSEPPSEATEVRLARGGWFRLPDSTISVPGVLGPFGPIEPSSVDLVATYARLISAAPPALPGGGEERADGAVLTAMHDRDQVLGFLARSLSVQYEVDQLRKDRDALTKKLEKSNNTVIALRRSRRYRIGSAFANPVSAMRPTRRRVKGGGASDQREIGT